MEFQYRPNTLRRCAGVFARMRLAIRAGLPRPAVAILCVAAVLVLPLTLETPGSSDSTTVLAWKQAQAAGGNGGGNGGGDGDSDGDSDSDTDSDTDSDGNAGARGKGNHSSVNDGAGKPASGGEGIARAQFTSGLSQRRPVDDLQTVDNDHEAISFYTQTAGMAGRTVTHRWIYGDSIRYEVTFNVMGDNWRFWSTQNLPRELAGDWTVEIVDDSGKILRSHTLDYQPAG